MLPRASACVTSAYSGMPTSLSVPVVAPDAEVGAEAALRAAPEVVGEPDRRDRRDGRHREPDQPRRRAAAGARGS